MQKQSAQEVIGIGESLRWQQQTAKYGKARLFLLGVSATSLTLSFLYKKVYAPRSQKEVDFKKERLAQPITELSDSNGTVFPWSQKNADEFLYRTFRITGRPLHNRAVLIPCKSYGLSGYQYIVPLCTKETPQGDPIEGVFINKGFVPHEKAHVSSRFRIEDSFHQQTFTTYLSKLENLAEHSAFQEGNSANALQRNKWNYADLTDMAKIANFKNGSVVSAGVLECVNLDTPLDERNARYIDVNSDYREDFPYQKTLPGALQSNNMPWDYKNTGNTYMNIGVASGILALLLSF